MTDTGDARPLRVCDLCGQVDDHPRHVIAGANPDGFPRVADDIVEKVIAGAPDEHRGRLVRELLDTSASDRHYQCCRDVGCPEGTCGLVIQDAGDLIGADLVDHLNENTEAIQARLDADYQRRTGAAIQTELLGGN